MMTCREVTALAHDRLDGVHGNPPRRRQDGPDAVRDAQARTYRFINAMAGDLPQCEEALRALFGRRGDDFVACLATWPADIREHVQQLAAAVFTPVNPAVSA